MRWLAVGFLLAFVAMANSSLLEMGQTLWNKVLEGGLTKIGALDPLRVPVVKVDQSEGNTSYRMILRSVEIIGLNASTLESVHIGRGRVKSNLREHEAGYVSYTDRKELDSIRYRFHTVVKEPKSEESRNLQVKSIPELEDERRNDDRAKERRNDNRDNERRNDSENRRGYNSRNSQDSRNQDRNSQNRETADYRNSRRRGEHEQSEVSGRRRDGIATNRRENEETIGVAASVNFESRRPYVNARISLPERKQMQQQQQDDDVEGRRRYENRANGGNRHSTSFAQRPNERTYQEYRESSSRLEDQPGYVDIVYADEKDRKMRHFGNLKVMPGEEKTVYSLEDVLKDLRDRKRFIIHNFTEGEALSKKNDAARIASETKRIRDMVRYAKEFQEKQGYYEQGMKLIYHYGDRDDDAISMDYQTRRNKRAHLDDDEDAQEDVMHVIMRIRVPMLRVNAGYVLMGKVGKQVLRGNGLLAGNFTELIGDFTLELKKVGEDAMVVRAARARLSAKRSRITLEGMDEEGPVKEILTHGLMAAEAVAAMLADDLATKALSEKTADSIIYKMYKDLPATDSQ